MISVIMANYNGDEFIKQAIQSVINQDYDNYEFIVVDDGSTDGSREIISDLQSQYPDKVKPIYQSDNQGQGVAFNAGIAASKGDLICFLDSDDLWFPDKLKNVYNFFTRRKKGVALHQHNLLTIRNDKVTKEKFRDILITGNYFNYANKTKRLPNFTPTSGLSFPRHVIEKVLPIPTIFRTCADGYLTRTCFCYGEIASTNECWGAYRIHQNNSVFGNPEFDILTYANKALILLLNEFYKENHIELKYPTQPNFFREILALSTPPILSKLLKRLLKIKQHRFTENKN